MIPAAARRWLLLCKQAALPGVSPKVVKLGRELALAIEAEQKAKEQAKLEEAATAKEGGDG